MLCVDPKLLFVATLSVSINNEQRNRQATGVGRHKAIITYKSTSESIEKLLMLALQTLAS